MVKSEKPTTTSTAAATTTTTTEKAVSPRTQKKLIGKINLRFLHEPHRSVRFVGTQLVESE